MPIRVGNSTITSGRSVRVVQGSSMLDGIVKMTDFRDTGMSFIFRIEDNESLINEFIKIANDMIKCVNGACWNVPMSFLNKIEAIGNIGRQGEVNTEMLYTVLEIFRDMLSVHTFLINGRLTKTFHEKLVQMFLMHYTKALALLELVSLKLNGPLCFPKEAKAENGEGSSSQESTPQPEEIPELRSLKKRKRKLSERLNYEILCKRTKIERDPTQVEKLQLVAKNILDVATRLMDHEEELRKMFQTVFEWSNTIINKIALVYNTGVFNGEGDSALRKMEFSVRKVLEAAGRLRDFSESFPEVDPSVRLGCENSNNLVFQLAAAAHSVHDELLLHETMPLNLPSTSAAPDLKEFGFIATHDRIREKDDESAKGQNTQNERNRNDEDKTIAENGSSDVANAQAPRNAADNRNNRSTRRVIADFLRSENLVGNLNLLVAAINGEETDGEDEATDKESDHDGDKEEEGDEEEKKGEEDETDLDDEDDDDDEDGDSGVLFMQRIYP